MLHVLRMRVLWHREASELLTKLDLVKKSKPTRQR